MILKIKGNYYNEIPKKIGNLTNLKELEMNMSKTPEEIKNLVNPKKLFNFSF